MIKNVLVGVDGSEHSQSALEHALWFAERFKATVVGLHVIDIVSIEGSFLHDISGSLGFEPYLDFSSRMREVLQERGRALMDEFEARVASAEIRSETAMEMGIIPNVLCERARTADLVVIGHRGINEKFSTGLLGSTAENVTRKCPKPLLVCPIEWKPFTNPMLAYDGSPRSASAMQSAAEFCVSTGLPLAVLHVAKDQTAGEKIVDEARRYLEPYDVRAAFQVRPGAAPEPIVDAIRDGGHDLLFIGAYGHTRIVEMVLGSSTEYVLRNSPCPVFLSR